jgi:hypothetical protein
VALGTFLV